MIRESRGDYFSSLLADREPPVSGCSRYQGAELKHIRLNDRMCFQELGSLTREPCHGRRYQREELPLPAEFVAGHECRPVAVTRRGLCVLHPGCDEGEPD